MADSENDFYFWQRPSFSLLSRAQLDRIYGAALEVLARVGGEFHDPAAVARLADAGARVENDNRVRIPAKTDVLRRERHPLHLDRGLSRRRGYGPDFPGGVPGGCPG